MTEINCPYCDTSQKVELPKDKGLEACISCRKPIDVYSDGRILKSNLRLATNATFEIPGNVCTGFGRSSFELETK